MTIPNKHISIAGRSGIIPAYASSSAFETAKGSAAAAKDMFFNTTTEEVIKYLSAGVAVNSASLTTSQISKSVKTSGGDFTSPQDCVDWFSNRILLTPGVMTLDPGTTAITNPLTTTYLMGLLRIVGDTRSIIGSFFSQGYTISSTDANAGTGTFSFSNSGNDLICTGSGSSPDFSTGGIVSGDKVAVRNNSGVWSAETVNSVSSGTITLTGTAPSVGSEGSALILLPNVIISATNGAFYLATYFTAISLEGVWVISSADDSKAVEIAQGFFRMTNCVIQQTGSTGTNGAGIKVFGNQSSLEIIGQNSIVGVYGNGAIVSESGNIFKENAERLFIADCLANNFYSSNNGFIDAYGCHSIGGNVGINAEYTGIIAADYSAVLGGAVAGVYSRQNSSISISNADVKAGTSSGSGVVTGFGSSVQADAVVSDGWLFGFLANSGASIEANGATAKNNTAGFVASRNGYINATNTFATTNGQNTTDYTPGTSDTAGTNGGVITIS